MIPHRATAAANRNAARLAGERTFHGTRCRAAGHNGERYTSTGACVECLAARYGAAVVAAGKPEPVRRGPQRNPRVMLAAACIL